MIFWSRKSINNQSKIHAKSIKNRSQSLPRTTFENGREKYRKVCQKGTNASHHFASIFGRKPEKNYQKNIENPMEIAKGNYYFFFSRMSYTVCAVYPQCDVVVCTLSLWKSIWITNNMYM